MDDYTRARIKKRAERCARKLAEVLGIPFEERKEDLIKAAELVLKVR